MSDSQVEEDIPPAPSEDDKLQKGDSTTPASGQDDVVKQDLLPQPPISQTPHPHLALFLQNSLAPSPPNICTDSDKDTLSFLIHEMDGRQTPYTFNLNQTLARGGFSVVKMATNNETGKTVAIKIIDKLQLGKDFFRIGVEVNVLTYLQHPHICNLHYAIATSSKFYMVLEYCPTDLYEHIVAHSSNLPLEETRKLFVQILSAVEFLHSNGVMHRDLKPENILLDRSGNARVTDFGLCATPGVLGIHQPITKTVCGSPAYCAPELLRGGPYVGAQADVWSLGVVLYVMLVGSLPFHSKNIRDLYRKIQEGKYTFPKSSLPLPPALDLELGKDVVRRLLVVDGAQRPRVTQLWEHPWIAEGVRRHFVIPYCQTAFSSSQPVMMTTTPYSSTSSIPYSNQATVRTNNSSRNTTINSTSFLEKPKKTFLNRICHWFSRSKNENNPVEEHVSLILSSQLNQFSSPSIGLTVVEEPFADCILDKIQASLQSLGVESKRRQGRSIVSHGPTSLFPFKFQVLYLEDLGKFCVLRKMRLEEERHRRLSQEKIVQRILLMSKDEGWV